MHNRTLNARTQEASHQRGLLGLLIQPSAMERIAGTTEPISEPSAVASRPRFHLGLGIVHFPGVCTLVGSRGRASVAQGCTLGWGMFGPRGADASGYALGGFDIA